MRKLKILLYDLPQFQVSLLREEEMCFDCVLGNGLLFLCSKTGTHGQLCTMPAGRVMTKL